MHNGGPEEAPMSARTVLVPFAIATALLTGTLRAEDAGKASFTKRCASCHGEDGRGNAQKATLLKLDPKLLDLHRAETADLTPAQRREIVVAGKNKMPAYGKKLPVAELDALMAYVEKLRQP
jgi:mono/diheme cytochrome c family protein